MEICSLFPGLSGFARHSGPAPQGIQFTVGRRWSPLRVLRVDTAVAERWERMNAVRPVPVIDALTAAMARANGLTLATRNAADALPSSDGLPVTGAFAHGIPVGVRRVGSENLHLECEAHQVFIGMIFGVDMELGGADARDAVTGWRSLTRSDRECRQICRHPPYPELHLLERLRRVAKRLALGSPRLQGPDAFFFVRAYLRARGPNRPRYCGRTPFQPADVRMRHLSGAPALSASLGGSSQFRERPKSTARTLPCFMVAPV